uniref:hypothetical protein n=1 Tax=Herbidospora sakaeratensis TaxID=564415 RepID=UPI000780BEE3|nr:hypothetical protein [Herbidospora sakaeratensis]
MSLRKTKRDATLDDRLAGEDVEHVFRTLESQVRGGDVDHPSRWVDVADADPAEQRWILHGLDLLARNADGAGPEFSGLRAASLLVDRARGRRHEPGGQRFEQEVMSASGWLEAALPSSLPLPGPTASARLAEIYGRPPVVFDAGTLAASVLPVLKAGLAEEALWWGSPAEPEDLSWMEKVAASIQRFVHEEGSSFPAAHAAGPLHDGFDYAASVIDAGAADDDADARLAFLRRRIHLVGRDASSGYALSAAGYDHAQPGHRDLLDDLLDEWLAADRELDDLIGLLLRHSPAHVAGERARVHLPAHLPAGSWGPKELWRPHLYAVMVHEFVHVLAHPDFTEAVESVADGQILAEGVVDLLTAELLDASRTDPDLGGLVPGDYAVGYGASGRAAIEIRDLAGADQVKAAFYLGRVEFIGLGPEEGWT